MSLERFDDIAEFFDRVTGTRLHWRLRRVAAVALQPVAGRRILDLGTGPGGLALDLARDGARVVGLDGSPDMLRRAAARMLRREGGGSVALVRGDAHRLPLGEGAVEDVTVRFRPTSLAYRITAASSCGFPGRNIQNGGRPRGAEPLSARSSCATGTREPLGSSALIIGRVSE